MDKAKLPVRLVVSDWMTERATRENGRIRIAKRARDSFRVTSGKIVVKTDRHAASLEVRAARKEDINPLIKKLKKGTLTEEELAVTAFVTAETLKQFVGRRRKNIEKFCYVSKDIEDLIIGADPEFALVDPATSMVKYAEYTRLLTKTGQLGHDGPLAEVRPPPADTVNGLVENIKKILSSGAKKLEHFNWVGGATYSGPDKERDPRTYHIGGHIHIGDASAIPHDKRTVIYQRLCKVLDDTVALPLVLIDTPDPHLRRNTMHGRHGKYGRSGDYKPQGTLETSSTRMEWRVPSGLWLTHPELAKAILGTTKAVAEEVYQTLSINGFDLDWLSAPPGREGFLKEWGVEEGDTVSNLINNSKPEDVPEALVGKCYDKLKSMSNYTKYQSEIDAFIEFTGFSENDRKNLNLDVKDSWLGRGNLINQTR